MAYNFDTIAANYDRMNRLMTLGLDRRWRKRAVREFSVLRSPFSVLDVACGTGDMMVSLIEQGYTVTGVDISEEMLNIARQKIASACSSPKLGEGDRREAVVEEYVKLADAEHLPFPDDTFDAVTCAFGVRNFVHLEQGLNEMLRVLKPGGTMVILELATPDSILLKPFYNLYTRHIIPWLGQLIAGNRQAYTYLPESIERFPKGDAFLNIILNSRFSIFNCRHLRLTFGVCRLYIVQKMTEKQ